MKRVYKIYIDNDIAEKISCAVYLSESHRSVLVSILSNPDLNINEALFNKYVDSYTEAYVYEQEIKSYMENLYVKKIPIKASIKNNNINWNLTYATGELLIEIDDQDMTDDTIVALAKTGFERVE